MASKNISIKKELYEQLELRKRQGESFSDVIKRLIIKDSENQDISICAGAWKGIPDDIFNDMEEHRKEMRRKLAKRFQK